MVVRCSPYGIVSDLSERICLNVKSGNAFINRHIYITLNDENYSNVCCKYSKPCCDLIVSTVEQNIQINFARLKNVLNINPTSFMDSLQWFFIRSMHNLFQSSVFVFKP